MKMDKVIMLFLCLGILFSCGSGEVVSDEGKIIGNLGVAFEQVESFGHISESPRSCSKISLLVRPDGIMNMRFF